MNQATMIATPSIASGDHPGTPRPWHRRASTADHQVRHAARSTPSIAHLEATHRRWAPISALTSEGVVASLRRTGSPSMSGFTPSTHSGSATAEPLLIVVCRLARARDPRSVAMALMLRRARSRAGRVAVPSRRSRSRAPSSPPAAPRPRAAPAAGACAAAEAAASRSRRRARWCARRAAPSITA